MKAGTTESMKFMVLKSKLRLPKFVVVGILESLWSLTASSAQDGAIGKFSNEEIAAWLEWDGDADALIAALVAARFLDLCDTNRLVVHDWQDHAPTYVRGNMAKAGRGFASPKEAPKDTPRDGPKDAPKEIPTGTSDGPKDGPTKSSLVKSIQVNPSQGRECAPEGGPPGGTVAGQVCARLISAGLPGVNPSHPKLLALLDAGLTPAEIVSAGDEAVAKGKPFAWALAAAEGRRREAVVDPLPKGRRAEPTVDLTFSPPAWAGDLEGVA